MEKTDQDADGEIPRHENDLDDSQNHPGQGHPPAAIVHAARPHLPQVRGRHGPGNHPKHTTAKRAAEDSQHEDNDAPMGVGEWRALAGRRGRRGIGTGGRLVVGEGIASAGLRERPSQRAVQAGWLAAIANPLRVGLGWSR